MKTLEVIDAQNRFSDLVRQATQGETFWITDHGKHVVTLSPTPTSAPSFSLKAMEDFRQKNAQALLKDLSVDEILSWRDDGRK